ncbi:MAG: serine/threonine protein kinase [Myxococcales bacterium]|nr:serine/threonine protein kinase [Myxococcales bacterium]
MASKEAALVLGRYALDEAIASGGMATIYLGHQTGAVDFSRIVAIKRLHPHFAAEPDFVSMFLDEARLAARVRHPNVVETLDVVREGAETFIVMQYVDGESLSGLLKAMGRAGRRMPLEVAVSITSGLCRGLHAAHEARGPDGAPLGIVHRDVSPQNILVGADGVTRVVDFGVALANVRLAQTRAGQVKGKPAYMAPEQLARDEVTRATDIYAAAVVFWELCAGRRAYEVANEGALIARVMTGSIPRLSEVAPWVPAPLAEVVHRALRREPTERFASALEMAEALERATVVATPTQVGAFVEELAQEALHERRAIAARLDRGAAAPPSGGLAAPKTSAPPPLAPFAPPSASVRPPGPTQLEPRGTHTVTSPGPLPKRSRPAIAAAAFMVAILTAAGAGIAGTWLVLRAEHQTGAASAATPPSQAAPPAPVASASDRGAETSGPQLTPPPPDDPRPTASSSAPNVDRMRPARPSADAASAPKPCDPPYFIDTEGIRRVKRECF